MRKKETEEQKNWGIGSPFTLSLFFPLNNFAWNHCFFHSSFIHSICALLSIFIETTFIWGMSSVAQISTISNHRSDSIQKNIVMLFCFVWAHLWIRAFQAGLPKKAPQYWWEKLFKLMASTRVCFLFC